MLVFIRRHLGFYPSPSWFLSVAILVSSVAILVFKEEIVDFLSFWPLGGSCEHNIEIPCEYLFWS